MEVRCDSCQALYRVDDARFGPGGLSMRCAKCQATFRVMPAVARAPVPVQTTMVFAAPAAAGRSADEPAASVAAIAQNGALDEAAGRTMVFPSAGAPKKSAEPAANSTILFSQPRSRTAPAAEEAGRSTIVFGGSPALQRAKTAAAVPEPAPEPVAQPTPVAVESVKVWAAPEEEREVPAREPGPFDKAPPRGLLIGVGAGLALLLAASAGLVAWRKLARHAPPPLAVEMLAAAESDARLDTLPSLASAEAKARDALDVAGSRARFPEGAAALARIEVQWADALDDQAARIAEKSPDDPRTTQLLTQARAKAKSAFEVLSLAAKVDRESTEVQLALADYYRAQRSPSNMNRWLRPLREDPRAALISAMAAAQQIDGAERALPRLKAAIAADPRSARAHFRLALAWSALKDTASARAELLETLRLSPQHERAKDLLEQLAAAAPKQ